MQSTFTKNELSIKDCTLTQFNTKFVLPEPFGPWTYKLHLLDSSALN